MSATREGTGEEGRRELLIHVRCEFGGREILVSRHKTGRAAEAAYFRHVRREPDVNWEVIDLMTGECKRHGTAAWVNRPNELRVAWLKLQQRELDAWKKRMTANKRDSEDDDGNE